MSEVRCFSWTGCPAIEACLHYLEGRRGRVTAACRACTGAAEKIAHRNVSMFSPSFPIAFCAKCKDVRLHFERHDYRPEWQCWCRDCVDGDYDQETGRTVATYPIGDGKTLFDALDDYAIRCDVETESLFAKEGM